MSKTSFSDGQILAGFDSIRTLFGEPTFLYHEDGERYFQIRAAVHETIKPQDALEEFWAHNIAEDMFDAQRWRRFASRAIENETHLGLQRILKRLVGPKKRARLVKGWRRGDEASREEAIEVLKKYRYDEASVQTEGFKIAAEVERMFGLLERAQNRIQSATRELNRHRDVTSRRLSEFGEGLGRGSKENGQ
jgi:hypothetical protein